MADPLVETIASDNCVVARVSGDMDYLTTPAFRPQFKELIARGDRFIVLDLSGMSFCDSAGLNILLRAWRQADASGAVLVLARVPELGLTVLGLRGELRLAVVHDQEGSANRLRGFAFAPLFAIPALMTAVT
ncbi:STAS domain-containing protein [Streptomyces sp. DH10]|uniref:STAS domain-containing protein n=1 Tax=Streptomyces sp. DH10 TaxID=3040121 RepID=UPI002442078F|nr:STAS domain-containing protein [Streptomyces sp. DH10]MDG9710572.1 STAS domain-containing protein [Streptomyces sp. DH10]